VGHIDARLALSAGVETIHRKRGVAIAATEIA
jgi:hypothetical protein